MKFLVTGASGFIGQYVISALEAVNYDYTTIGRAIKDKDPNHICADLLATEDFSAIISGINPTHLIHLGWYVEHGKYWDSPLNIKWMDVTYRLLDAFYKNGGQHALISGTCAEYDWKYGYCSEGSTPTSPATIYGVIKDSTRRMSELMSRQYGSTLTWGRIFFPYGPGESQHRLVPSLFDVFRQKCEPFGVGSESYRDFLHASDLAQAILICSIKKYHGAINLCSGKPLSVETLVKKISQVCNQNPEQILKLSSQRYGEPRLLVGDNQILLSLGWRQKISLYEGLINYEKEGKL